MLDVRGTHREGVDDVSLWALAQEEERLLITTDKGFGSRRAETHHGILIVRLRQPNARKIHERVFQALERYPTEAWPGLLVVMRDAVQSV